MAETTNRNKKKTKKKKKKSAQTLPGKSFREIDRDLRATLARLVAQSKDITSKSTVLGNRLKVVIRQIQRELDANNQSRQRYH